MLRREDRVGIPAHSALSAEDLCSRGSPWWRTVCAMGVADLVSLWQDEIARLDPRLSELVITCDHGDFWHFTFELGEIGHEALSVDLETFSFVDEQGYFDHEVPAAGVPAQLAGLFA